MVLWSVIDTETTGLYDEDYAVSLGTLIADINPERRMIECVDSMYSLIRIPDPSMTEKTRHIHGISSEEVARAPGPAEVCGQYLKLLDQHEFRHAAAWNQSFDRRFVEKLFDQAEMKRPVLRWMEMQPFHRARLDSHACNLKCDSIRALSGHHALKDCARAIGVFAENNGYALDTSSVMKALSTCK
jgi:DNA polymerase III epsilon subunit-like protein